MAALRRELEESMKLASWNCNGALRKKLVEADSLSADILIVEECEDPDKSTQAYRDWAEDYIWCGRNKNKGIGVFARNRYKISPLQWSGQHRIEGILSGNKVTSWKTEELECFLPFTINDEYTVLAVWTKNPDGDVFGYIGQLWKYLQIHGDQLKGDKVIIAGDFNSNAIWDRKGRCWSHSEVVKQLEGMGLRSLYHSKYGETPGKEATPTLYLQKNPDKPYHIDFVFLSECMVPKSSIKIGKRDNWLKVSDHMPVIAELTS